MTGFIKMSAELTPDGVIIREPVLGQIARIKRRDASLPTARWEVYPYAFAPSERLAEFKSYKAAEHYALALAYEMAETR